MDVEPTAEVIDKAATRFRETAAALDRIASRMRERVDLTYATEALSEIINAIQTSRVDLLVTRPIRALQSELERPVRGKVNDGSQND